MPAPGSLRTSDPISLERRPPLEPARLLRVHRSAKCLTLAKLLGWLAEAETQGTPFFAWRDPMANLEVAGVATAWQSRTNRAQEDESEACSRIRGQRHVTLGPPIPAGVPAVWVGRSFFGADPKGCWDGWPRSCARLPRILAYRTPQGVGWVAQAFARSHDDEAVVAELHSELRSVERQFLALDEHRCETPQSTRTALQSDDAWRDLVRNARTAVRRGALAKVVVARGVLHRATTTYDRVATLAALWRKHPGAFGFAMDLGVEGCFLGATPELLVRVEGRRVDAQALAGTAPRAPNPDEDRRLGESLLACPKNRLEHQLVVNAVDQALRPQCTELKASEQPSLKRLPGLQHLETRFTGTLQVGRSAEELARSLHPTPAVGGWPRLGALAWLRRFEGLDRGWYAAPVGVLSPNGDGVFAVAIRSALLRGADAWAFAGAGIVADSDPQLELDETELKLGTIASALKVRAR